MADEGGWWRRLDPNMLLIGVSVAIATIAIGTGIAVYVTADSSRGDSRASGLETSDATVPDSPRASSTTTTTTEPPTTTTTAPPGGASGGSSAATQDPSRYAFSDPEDDPYEPVPTVEGVTATIEACAWSAENGGELQASGTLSSAPDADDFWIVEVYWLQNERELDSQSDFFDLAPGQSTPWRLTLPAPLPPADPFRCALEVD